MKISLDAGALCSKNHFGNYTLTKNFIEAVSQYDDKNEYFLYSFCDKPSWLKTGKKIHYRKLLPKKFWLTGRVTAEELINPKDIFLALNQAIPLFTTSKIISFSHGLSFQFFPQYYPDSYRNLKKQLDTMKKKSQLIIVSSTKIKQELVSIYRYIDTRVRIMPFGIPFDMLDSGAGRAGVSSSRQKFFLYVGMNHPIKNIKFIKKAFVEFKKDNNYKNYKLYIITKNASREKLKQLYQRAAALLTASFYESFNLPVVEALSCGCPVVGLQSAIVPELLPYVHTAKNLKEFVGEMKKIVTSQAKPINQKKLKKQFSWKKYVHELTTLY